MKLIKVQLRDIEDIWINLSQVAYFHRNKHGNRPNRITLYLSNGTVLSVEGSAVLSFIENLEEFGNSEELSNCEASIL